MLLDCGLVSKVLVPLSILDVVTVLKSLLLKDECCRLLTACLYSCCTLLYFHSKLSAISYTYLPPHMHHKYLSIASLNLGMLSMC